MSSIVFPFSIVQLEYYTNYPLSILKRNVIKLDRMTDQNTPNQQLLPLNTIPTFSPLLLPCFQNTNPATIPKRKPKITFALCNSTTSFFVLLAFILSTR